ncbi:MAG TPA: ABC transporter permease [Acidobacteriaceae bacterium]|nr:ABC transporter permease [Acidobacteriaceae bacterium]
MTRVIQDLQYAGRQLRKTPGFTVTVLLTLALGIGANAAIFTLVNSVLLAHLPVTDPKMLIKLGNENDCCVGNGTRDDGNYSMFSTHTYEVLRANLPEFEDLAAIQAGFLYRPVTARGSAPNALPRSVMGEFVSGNYFRTFGVAAFAGRLFTDADNVQGAPMTAVMSYESWQREYAGDRALVGSTFWINTKPVTVVGIAPQGFFGDRLAATPPEFYLPIETMPVLANVPYVHSPDTNWLYMVGRVKPGVALGPLQQKVSALLRQAIESNPGFKGEEGRARWARAHIVLTPGGAGIQAMQEQYKSHLRLLMWISSLVLLIACANIANLLLARGMSRKAEISVRAALGATRRRIVQQLLTESLLLALSGGALALLVSYAGTSLLLSQAFPWAHNMPIQAAPSLPVLGFALAISMVTGILFGIAPAWIASHAQPADALRSSTRTTAGGASLLQRTLVVLQAALSLILLVGAGLFVESLNKERSIDLKLDPTNRYVAHFDAAAAGYKQSQLEALYRTMEERLHLLPGVVQVGVASYSPMEDNNNGYGVQVEGKPETTGASRIRVNAEYFASVGTKVIAGRGIGPQDTASSAAVAVVNENFVQKMFKPGENPIGAHIGSPGPKSSGDFQIVGVVENTAYQSALWKDHRMFFIPLMRRPPSDDSPIETDDGLYVNAIVLETSKPINDLENQVRSTMASINPNLTLQNFKPFSEQISTMFTEEKLVAKLSTLFGALSLLLAALGLYGVTAYSVARRRSEIGIRMALGAERASVVSMVMRGALGQTLLGLAIGVPIAYFCVRFVKTQLYEITSVSPTVMGLAIVTLAVAACVAGVLPARRAASIDPARALRME